LLLLLVKQNRKNKFSFVDLKIEIPQELLLKCPINANDLKLINEVLLTCIILHFGHGKYIQTKTLEAYTQQANYEDAKNELAAWIRFSNADVKATRDGLTTGGMGIKGFGGFMVRNFFKPSDSKKQSFVDKGVDKTKAQAESCAGWILILQTEDTPENWINTGRIYEQMNITCSKLGIGFHPMNQMIEERNFENEVQIYLNNQGVIQFVARIGYVKETNKSSSVRRPVNSFTEFQQ
jgi:hypothetical protein